MSVPQPSKIACVILNWNGGAIVKRCLKSLIDSGDTFFRILLVDNGSEDGSSQDALALFPSSEFPEIELFENGENLGYAEGNNRGIRHALALGADSILLLNNDAFVAPGFLKPLLRALATNPSVGLAGPKVLDADRPDVLWCAGADITFGRNVSRLRGHGKRDSGAYDREENVDYIPGAALLIRREVFETIGELDPLYFCYMEDVDFCMRAREAHFSVRYVPDSIVFHRSSTSTGGGYTPLRKYMNAVNSIRFMKRHGSFTRWTRFVFADIVTLPLMLVFAVARGQGRAGWAKSRGIVDGLCGVTLDRTHLRRRFTQAGL